MPPRPRRLSLPLQSASVPAPTPQMHVKYNAVLRGCTSDSMDGAWTKFDQLCKGNKYATTLHVVNSAVVKLSKLTKAAKVYRGMSGGVA